MISPSRPTHSMRVALRECRFFARHGVMEHERRAGNEFEVSLEVCYTPGDPLSDSLEGTISYADLYEIAAAEMQTPAQLLETVAARITARATQRWPQISSMSVTIVKITPPIAGITGRAEVTYEFLASHDSLSEMPHKTGFC